MGVLAFVAPADGKYVLTAAVWNPWGQNCEKFTFKLNDTVIYEQDMTELEAVYGYITPTDVEMKSGDVIYMFLNSADSSWVSGYINATVYYEPQDDSCYVIPDVPQPQDPEEPFVPTSEAQYNAYDQFDKAAADGSNVPWVYASTTDGATFTAMAAYEDKDYGAHQWFSAGGTGIGPADYTGEGWLELNTTDAGGEMTAIGFKAPAAGTYILSGYTANPYGQMAGEFCVVRNGEQVESLWVFVDPMDFELEMELEADEVVYFYCTSEEGWVSASLALYADAK